MGEGRGGRTRLLKDPPAGVKLFLIQGVKKKKKKKLQIHIKIVRVQYCRNADAGVSC